MTVEDHEFYLHWRSYNKDYGDEGNAPMSLTRAQQITDRADDLRFPSYDEFISLVEGLNSVGKGNMFRRIDVLSNIRQSGREKTLTGEYWKS